MIEVIVVVLIIAIIGAITALNVDRGRSKGHAAQGRATARALGEAVQQFQRDHGGRLPGAPGSADWGNAYLGPVDKANGNRPYARKSTLVAITDGVVGFQGGANPSAPVRLRYVADANAGQFGFVVSVRKGNAHVPSCYVTNASGGGFINQLGAPGPC